MPQEPDANSRHSKNTLFFVIILCLTCAIILAILAHILKSPQEKAAELDRSKQMLIAAQIYNPQGYFQIRSSDSQYAPAKFDQKNKMLIPGTIKDTATADQILSVYNSRIISFLTNNQGEIRTFQETGINQANYIDENKKTGYAALPWKLIYAILPNQPALDNPSESPPEGYIIPVAGFGLWDAIYGYIALQKNGDQVIGITWYKQAETPGLGAVITEAAWQKQFPGKSIFQKDSQGKADFQTAPIGITVVRGKVGEVYGTSPKASSAVDGIAGATITGNGVTKAYKASLTPYRPFFIKINQGSSRNEREQHSQ
jgi:Na+-transporting NADH:ubiquinone oxidoreductase subunit C